MLLRLPRRFKLSFAEVKGEELLIYRLVRFEDMMYELTYACRKKKCAYCAKKLNRKNGTLDHRYPRHTGGISITNNLFPCCAKCNSRKSNLTHNEYLNMENLFEKEKKKYLNKIIGYNQRIMRRIGFKLPRKWVTFEELDNITYVPPAESLRGKRYYRVLEFYSKHNKLPRPIVVDKNNKLLDGYNIILFSKDFEIPKIPVIKLENVELRLGEEL